MCQIAPSKSAQKKEEIFFLRGDSSDSSDSNDSGDSSDQTTLYTKTSHWLSNVSNYSFQKYCILTVVTAVTVVTVVRKIAQALKKIYFFSEHFLKEQFDTFDNRWDVLRAAFCDFLGCIIFLMVVTLFLWGGCVVFLWRGCMIFCC